MGRKTSKQDIGVFDITAALDRLSLAQLNNLKSHKYSAHGISILTPLLGSILGMGGEPSSQYSCTKYADFNWFNVQSGWVPFTFKLLWN